MRAAFDKKVYTLSYMHDKSAWANTHARTHARARQSVRRRSFAHRIAPRVARPFARRREIKLQTYLRYLGMGLGGLRRRATAGAGGVEGEVRLRSVAGGIGVIRIVTLTSRRRRRLFAWIPDTTDARRKNVYHIMPPLSDDGGGGGGRVLLLAVVRAHRWHSNFSCWRRQHALVHLLNLPAFCVCVQKNAPLWGRSAAAWQFIRTHAPKFAADSAS